MSINAALARTLSEIASMIELLGEDSFRASANARAARAIEDFPTDLASIGAGPTGKADLQKIEGIGSKIADKVLEFIATGAIKEHEELKASVPPGLMELLQVQGLGPKTVRVFWTQAGVTSVADLHRIISDGSILKLPRMGEKSVEKLKGSLAMLAESGKRLRLGPAAITADAVIAYLKKHAKLTQIEAAGSLRRGKDTIGDIDILAATSDPEGVTAAFTEMPGVVSILASGATKSSVRMTIPTDDDLDEPETGAAAAVGVKPAKGGPSVQVDLRVVPAEHWGAALMYFTGSKEFNVKMRQRALDRGMTLNEYGLYPEDKGEKPPQSRGIKAVASASEHDIFKAMGMPDVPPEMREDRGKMALKTLPKLIELSDIKADLHSHTTASDGKMSIVELAEEAKRRGFHTIAVTDHSQSSAIAGGLKPDRLKKHVEAIHAARAKMPGITILAGSEVDILADGELDYDDDILALLDVVVASPHTALKQDSRAATARLLKAIAHPRVNILGHPTGRLVLRRAGLEPDMAQVYAAAKRHNVALEINAHWMRLDLRDVHVRGAMDAGCLIAINCDVHYPADYDNLRFGVTTARRGWVTAERCVNTWSAGALREWLKK